MASEETPTVVTATEGAVTSHASRLMSAFNLLGLVVASILLYVFFTWKLPGTFLTLTNIETIAVQSTIVSFAALGMTLIIVAGAIDLSVGSSVALVTVVVALTLPDRSPWFALGCGIFAGALTGYVNGIVVTKLRVLPFIVTLGTMQMFRGVARGLGHDNTVEAPKTWLNELLRSVPKDERWKLFPVGVWLMILMSVLVAVLLRATVFGRNIVAVGSNETAARMSGIHVERTKLAVFVLGGVFAGFAGVMQFARLSVGDPTVAVGLELDVIAAVVIGGGSLSGGQGSILGAVIGAVFMTTMANGFAQLGLPEWVQYIVKGGIIVIAVALDRLRGKSSAG